jgi:hypothetical protein
MIGGGVFGPVAVYQQLVAPPGQAPELLGHEGHERVQQDHALIEHPGHGGAGFRRAGLVGQQRLGEFHVPVADLAPGEGIKRVGRVVEAIGCKGRVDFFADARGLAQDPAVGGGRGGGRGGAGFVPFPDAVHLGKAGGVPQLGVKLR